MEEAERMHAIEKAASLLRKAFGPTARVTIVLRDSLGDDGTLEVSEAAVISNDNPELLVQLFAGQVAGLHQLKREVKATRVDSASSSEATRREAAELARMVGYDPDKMRWRR